MSKQKSEPSESSVPPAAAVPASAGTDELPVPVPHSPLTESELEDLKSRAEKGQQYYEQLLRTTADLENYRKRAVRERQEAVKFANESLLQKLVPVLDTFDMAMVAAAASNTTVQTLQAGIAMIHQQLKAALADAGLEEVDAAGKAFDPNIHEAVAQEASTEVADGHVLRQMRKGYRLRERLLRPATVVVAHPPQTDSPSTSPSGASN